MVVPSADLIVSNTCNLQYIVRGEQLASGEVLYEDPGTYEWAERYGLFRFSDIGLDHDENMPLSSTMESYTFMQSDKFIYRNGKLISEYDMSEAARLERHLLDLEVFKKVHVRTEVRTTTTRQPEFDPGEDAELLIEGLNEGTPGRACLIDLLPRLSHENVMALRREYGRLLQAKNSFSELPLQIERQVDGTLGKICYATSLGRWESEAYWIRVWYQSKEKQTFADLRWLLIDTLVGRTSAEVFAIKKAFRDDRYSDDLVSCMNKELEGHELQSLIMASIRPRPDISVTSKESYETILSNLYLALKNAADDRMECERVCVENLVEQTPGVLMDLMRDFQRNYGKMLPDSIKLIVRPILVSFTIHGAGVYNHINT